MHALLAIRLTEGSPLRGPMEKRDDADDGNSMLLLSVIVAREISSPTSVSLTIVRCFNPFVEATPPEGVPSIERVKEHRLKKNYRFPIDRAAIIDPI